MMEYNQETKHLPKIGILEYPSHTFKHDIARAKISFINILAKWGKRKVIA